MKKSSILIIILISTSFLYSQNLKYAKKIIQKLTSPELRGRGYTKNGNKLAAKYISDEYKKNGLNPFTKTYYQKFNISVNTFPNTMLFKFYNNTFTPGVDYLIHPSSPSIKGKYKVLKTDRDGINTKEKFNNLTNKASNSFILVDNTAKKYGDKELNKTIDDFISILQYNSKLSCKGVIIYTKKKLTWSNSTKLNPRPIIHINKELDLNTINSIEVDIENKYIENYETQNIIGFIKGRLQPDSFIVVTAHYDHLGTMGKDTYFPGANDNASGIAMILNIAKYYSQNQPKYSMVFISLAAEEIGLYGAYEFTENPFFGLEKIKFLVNFDMAGTGEEGIMVVNGSIFVHEFDLLSKINTKYKLLPKIDIRDEACISDHCMFYKKNVPCFYIYTLGGIKAYHDIYDKYETLPLTEFIDYKNLMIKFFDKL